MLKVNKDSIEYLPVLVTDKLSGITSLDGYTTSFRITDANEVQVVDWTSCNTTDMTVLPLIDATSLDEGNYKLYVKIVISPESVILGPYSFAVS